MSTSLIPKRVESATGALAKICAADWLAFSLAEERDRERERTVHERWKFEPSTVQKNSQLGRRFVHVADELLDRREPDGLLEEEPGDGVARDGAERGQHEEQLAEPERLRRVGGGDVLAERQLGLVLEPRHGGRLLEVAQVLASDRRECCEKRNWDQIRINWIVTSHVKRILKLNTSRLGLWVPPALLFLDSSQILDRWYLHENLACSVCMNNLKVSKFRS